MMPGPAELQKAREKKLAEEAGASEVKTIENSEVDTEDDGMEVVSHHTGSISGSRRDITELVGILYGLHMEYQTKIMDIMELGIQSERQWDIARRQTMKLVHQQFRAQDAVIRQTMKKLLDAPVATNGKEKK